MRWTTPRPGRRRGANLSRISQMGRMVMRGASVLRWSVGFAAHLLLVLFLSLPANAANNTADFAHRLARVLKMEAADPAAALSALQARQIVPPEAKADDAITPELAQSIIERLIRSGQKPEAAAHISAYAAMYAGVPVNVVVQGAVAAAQAAG